MIALAEKIQITFYSVPMTIQTLIVLTTGMSMGVIYLDMFALLDVVGAASF